MSDCSPHEDALMKLYDLAWTRWSDWMHFHELAMSEPFRAEAEALSLCTEMMKLISEAGIDQGHEVRSVSS